MELKIPKIRPINRSDLNKFKHYGHSVRGYIIELDGEYLAVFGVLHTIPLQAFSEMKEEMKKYPRVIMKAIKSFRETLEKYNNPVYAVASEKYENSGKVLERIGFNEIQEGYYQWKE